MVRKCEHLSLALAAPLLAGMLVLPSDASADSRSAGFAIQDDYEWQEYRKSFGGGGADSAAMSSNLPANATTKDVQGYIRDSLNSNGGLNEDVKIVGKKRNDDGSYRVAVTYYGANNTQKNMVVVMNQGGNVTDANMNMTDQELQAAYDEIVYGYGTEDGKPTNEMSVWEKISVNEVLHDKSQQFFQNVANDLGVDADTASKAAANAVSLAGVVIMGAGATGQRKKELLESAVKSVQEAQAKANQSSSKSGTAASSSSVNVERAESGIYEDYSDYGVSSLTQPTQNFLNTITTRFYEATGVVLNVTSTLRPYDTGSYHSDGIAFDVANDEFETGANGYSGWELRNLYGQMAREMGGTPLDEYPGGEGVQYNRGYNYHISVHNQSDWA